MPSDRYSLRNSDGNLVKAENNNFVIVRGKQNGPFDSLNLGSLPTQNSVSIRPVNCITRPNHVLWTLKTGPEAKQWFKEHYPRVGFDDVDLIPDEEWDRFANAEGLAFPPCQYCPGLQASPVSGECGIVLLGDAAHAFSPDIGQGINAGLMDVVQLHKTMQSSAKTRSLGMVLKDYELVRAPEVSNFGDIKYFTHFQTYLTYLDIQLSSAFINAHQTKALIRIARFGSPYQVSTQHNVIMQCSSLLSNTRTNV